MFVPVIGPDRRPLMPTSPSRARRWIKSGKATPFWKNQIFCVRLNQEPSDTKTQQVALGVDPGSKREGFTVKSRAHTYLNVLVDAPDHVKDAVTERRALRRSRRNRNTPCRQNRQNRKRSKGFLPPSTRTRWQNKSRIIDILMKIYPITDIVVEDICAESKKGKKRWNMSFSPLEVGKKWFYVETEKKCRLTLMKGYETFELRNAHCLKKLKDKLSDSFYSHNVDSWVLANSVVSGHNSPDNVEVKRMVPIRFHRRQLHRVQPARGKGGKRKRYGGTISLGLKKGGLVKHSKHGLCYVGGSLNDRISLHSLVDGKRVTQSARLKDVKFLAYNSFRTLGENPTGLVPVDESPRSKK